MPPQDPTSVPSAPTASTGSPAPAASDGHRLGIPHPDTADPDILCAEGRGGVIILCDHASNAVPRDLNALGLDDAALQDHIAWDIGAASVAAMISRMMQVPAVLAPVSRLVIDCNRDADDPTLVPMVSDGVVIPGNQGLDKARIAARKTAYYDPFHRAAGDLVAAHLAEGLVPMVIGMHSFTPAMNGTPRPWQIGFLWNRDPRLAQALIGLVERETDLTVGDNQPYSGRDLYTSMQRHGADHGLPQTTVEIRQDLLADRRMCAEWAELLANLLDECLSRPDILSIRHY